MCNKHSLMSECLLYGTSFSPLNSLSSTGSLWLNNLDSMMSRRVSLRGSKASRSGIKKWITLWLHILFVSVHSQSLKTSSCLLIPFSARPKCQRSILSLYWEPEQYAAGMMRLGEAVSLCILNKGL